MAVFPNSTIVMLTDSEGSSGFSRNPPPPSQQAILACLAYPIDCTRFGCEGPEAPMARPLTQTVGLFTLLLVLLLDQLFGVHDFRFGDFILQFQLRLFVCLDLQIVAQL